MKIKQVNQFKCLVFTITSDGNCDTEIKKRIAIAKDTFSKLSTVFKNRNISMETKLRVLQCYVWSTLLYGCECWTISKELETRLKATEMWFLRRILRISWTDMKSNTQVLQMAGIERSLMKTIKRRQLEFLGHILRKDELEKLVLCGKIEGKKSIGS